MILSRVHTQFLGERGALTRTEFLTILSDSDYMAGVKEKLNMIARFSVPSLPAARR